MLTLLLPIRVWRTISSDELLVVIKFHIAHTSESFNVCCFVWSWHIQRDINAVINLHADDFSFYQLKVATETVQCISGWDSIFVEVYWTWFLYERELNIFGIIITEALGNCRFLISSIILNQRMPINNKNTSQGAYIFQKTLFRGLLFKGLKKRVRNGIEICVLKSA